ncbi:hypothetical protein RM780_26765 [Streptomyces sp. DSM 44917]|uniref:Uncharacterized protein n=1 Tax=Streptomyces boetiae TaxID=3075541 RepID=A0ABU2LG06_9ACTN|nr:hypothetical protein [Streptomyces sp. DSM 44917]MDT0310521.1 hypothetical protein [Streptomyces sp. DSM 44917]
MSDAIMEGVTVDASTVRLGDQILVGGQCYTVTDMTALPRGGRRLEFNGGESFTMRATTVLWATRRRPVAPPRGGRGLPRGWGTIR